jgi:hypothetical protein
MSACRRRRVFTVLLSLCALLFAQLALAGYSCPGAQKAVEVARMAEAGMPCAQSMSMAMDEEQTSLCHAHCQGSQQAADTSQPPPLASFQQLGAVLTVAAPAPPTKAPFTGPLRPNVNPPLAIAHCCFRI